ncbi:ubiquitin carboxyl-terminal hydrolase 50 isoform 2-T2 [Discoglossus pictus]
MDSDEESYPSCAKIEEGSSLSSGRIVRQDGVCEHKKNQGATGLFNLGNCCYMNAVIQCLCSTTPLVEYFLTGQIQTSVAGEKREVVSAFAELMYHLWFGEHNCLSPQDFWIAISKVHPPFGRRSQQDAQELLIYTLNALHDELTKTPKRKSSGVKESTSTVASSLSESSIITRLLQGVLRHDTVCLECGYTSHKNEICTVISLPIPHGFQRSLQECLECFFQQVMLTWSDKIFCTFCKIKQDTSVKVRICKPPKIIIFHLKRFEYEGQLKRKLKTNITFPLKNLDLSPFFSPFNLKHPKYNLYAVVNHFGDMDEGHYTAYCKNAGTKQWNAFDDARIYNITEAMVQSSSAYILFYTSQAFSVPRKTSSCYVK